MIMWNCRLNPDVGYSSGDREGKVTSRQYETAIVACARWEMPYITEWIIYHLNLGFDHIYIYCNDDDPAPFKATLDRLPGQIRKAVSYRPYFGAGLQSSMYIDAFATCSPGGELGLLSRHRRIYCPQAVAFDFASGGTAQ